MKVEFLMWRLIRDLGGAAKCAAICGVARTAPYGWIKRGYMNTSTLSMLLTHARKRKMGIRLDSYFVTDTRLRWRR